MTFAQDLLRSHGMAWTPPVMQQKEKKSHAVEFTLKARRNQRRGITTMKGLHHANCPMINRREYGWRFYVKGRVHMGTYRDFTRALIAKKLYLYWLEAGFSPEEIPNTLSPEFRKYGVIYKDADI